MRSRGSDASSRHRSGGRIVVTGRDIKLKGAVVDASGKTGGGTINIGGGRQGQGSLQRSDTVSIDSATTIKADAITSGNGGNVVVWSDNLTTFAGTISAKGGTLAGNGGDAEVSGKAKLAYAGFTNLTAANGAFGTLLLDPYNVTISNDANRNQANFTATGNDSVINAGTLITALGGANITITTGSGGAQDGNITLAANTPLSWTSNTTLTLIGGRQITFYSDINASAGGLTLNSPSGGMISSRGAVSVARFTLNSGFWIQNDPNLPAFTAGDFQLNGGSFQRTAGGTGSTSSPYLLTDIYGLQGIGTDTYPANYRLSGNIDASGTATWNGGAGFSPLRNNGAMFASNLDGASHTITGLTINRPGQDYVGLIGNLGTGGSVSNLNLVGGSITGGNEVGALVGYNSGTVSRSTSSSTVLGSSDVGGLVGNNGATVTQSYASGRVAGSSNNVGGLVGTNADTVTQSYAIGNVSGSGSNVGGLVGYSIGTVSQAYATGDVAGAGGYVGGLIGWNSTSGTVYQSYASGSVSSFGERVGGLVGYNAGSVNQSYATGSTSGSGFVGGLVGFNEGGDVSHSYASGNVAGSYLYGGLIGLNTGTISASYWDTQTTGQTTADGTGQPFAGAVGLTTAQARSQAGYVNPSDPTQNFDFANVWYQAGDMRPILRSEAAAPVNGVIPVSNLHQLQLMGANLGGSYAMTRDIDASATSSTANSGGIFGAGGFVPVSGTSGFTGSLNGASHTISGLTVNLPNQSYVGLFGYIGTSGSVTNLGLVGGSVSGFGIAGGLAGENDGSISQSYATGSLSISTSGAGGLVGFNSGTISQSYATVNVVAPSVVGGLVGSNGGTVTQSYATGNVSGYGSQVGGLVGFNGNRISQSYATGNVSSTYFDVGGLVGENYDGTIVQSYAVGHVSGSSKVGGLVGANDGTGVGTITSSYWNTDVAGSTGVGLGSSSGATGLTTLQMTDLANFRTNYTGFDFANVWSPPNQIGQGGQTAAYYPQLYALSHVLAVMPNAVSRVYGNANPSLIATYSGLRAGDLVTTPGTLSTSASTATGVGVYGATASGTSVTAADGSSYRILYVPGTLTITARPVTVTANAGQSRVYGDADPAFFYAVGPTVSGSGLVNGDALTGALTSNATATTGVGSTSLITQGTLAASANYSLHYIGANLTITPRSIMIVPNKQSWVYGDASKELTYQVPPDQGGVNRGLVNGDQLNGTLSTTATASSNVGQYPVFRGSITTAANPNYAINVSSGLPGDLTITPRVIMVAGAMGVNKTYDGSTALPVGVSGFTFLGVLGADAGRVGVSAQSAGYAVADAGPEAVFVNGLSLSGAAAGNYVLSATTVIGSGTISPATLTYTANAASRTYGAANPVFGGTVSGFLGSDTQSGATSGTLTFTAAATAASNVGNTAITGSGLGAKNYVFVQAAGNAGALSITPAPLTVTGTKVYDATIGFTIGQLSVAGAVNGESVSLTQGIGIGPATNVGSWANSILRNLAIQVSGGNAAAGNYQLPALGTLTITPAPVIVTANSGRSVYGDTSVNPGLSASGLQNNENPATVLTGLSNSFGINATSKAGGYTTSVTGTLTNANYTVASTVAGSWIVTPRALTITADAQSRVYGDGNPPLTFKASTTSGTGIVTSGLVNGDVLSGALTTSADIRSNAGSVNPITQGTLTASANYTLNYIGANLTITARPLTITATNQSKVYGHIASLGTTAFNAAGLVNGDVVSGVMLASTGTAATATVAGGPYTITASNPTGTGLSNYTISTVPGTLTVTPKSITITAANQSKMYGQTFTFGTTNIGLLNGDAITGITLTSPGTAATATVAGGPYVITASNAVGRGLGNYSIAYAPGTLTVTPRPITVTAYAQSRVYGDGNPGLAYAIGGNGLANNDTLSGTLATSATTTSNVGSYAITRGSLAASSNYALTYSATPVYLTVTPRPLSIYANGQSRPFLSNNPALTYALGGAGLVNGDQLTGSLTTGASFFSSPGNYAITQGSLAASPNYAVTFQQANLVVTPIVYFYNPFWCFGWFGGLNLFF